MKRAILFAIAVLFCVSYSSGQYFTIDTLREFVPSDWFASPIEYTFPIIKNKLNPRAADSINMDLPVFFLKIVPGKQKKSLFENISGDSATGRRAAMVGVSYQEVNNDAYIFSIGITAHADVDGGGHYIDMTKFYNYNSKTGHRIFLNELFTDNGAKLISDSVHKIIVNKIESIMPTLDSLLKLERYEKGANTNILLPSQVSINIYSDCEKYMYERFYEEVEYNLKKTNLEINVPSCMSYNEMMSEVFGEFTIEFDLKGWKPYLSNYGKELLKL